MMMSRADTCHDIGKESPMQHTMQMGPKKI
jgi:hypothetical protein